MSKKLIALALIIMSFVTFTNFKVKAVEPVLTWSSDNLFSNYYRLKGEGVIPNDALSIKLFLPDTQYHTLLAGGVTTQVIFRTGETIIKTVEWVELFGQQISGDFIFDLELLNVLNADNIIFSIMQNYTATPGNYVNFIQTNYTIEYQNFKPFDENITWLNTNLFSTFYALTTKFQLPRDFQIASIFIPYSIYHTYEIGGVDAEVVLYDITDSVIDTLLLSDLGTFTSGVFNINVKQLGLDIGDVFKIGITLTQNYTILPSQYMAFMNENTRLEYDVNIKVIRFFINGILNEQDTFTDIPPNYSGVIPLGPTQRFEYWVTANGVPYYFNTVVTDAMTINGNFNLYAYIVNTNDITPPDIEEPTDITPTNFLVLLNVFGMDNPIGYIVFWFIVTMLITIAGLIIRIPFFAIIVSNVIMTSFVVYLGMLPFVLIIVVYLLYAIGLFMSIKGGSNE